MDNVNVIIDEIFLWVLGFLVFFLWVSPWKLKNVKKVTKNNIIEDAKFHGANKKLGRAQGIPMGRGNI